MQAMNSALFNPHLPLDAESAARVQAVEVPENERLAFLPRYFEPDLLGFENRLYGTLQELAPSYCGGFWSFHTLSNGGAFCVPTPGTQLIRLGPLPNYFDRAVTREAAGIIATLYTLSRLSFDRQHQDTWAERYHQLREFAVDHPESAAIFAAID